MLNSVLRSSLIVGWFVTVVTIVGVSVAMGASVSTAALFVVLGLAPAIVSLLIVGGAPAPSVAQILHSVETDV